MKRQRLFMFFAGAILLFCNCALSYAFTLPATGQTKCYDENGIVIACAGTGEDAAHIVNPKSYTDNGNGTITDNVTGLMWQKQGAGNAYNWFQASGTYSKTENSTSQNVCGVLTTGGHSDWRLPAIMELKSLVDYSSYPGPAINTTYFPNTQQYFYWSSTTGAGGSGSAWGVYFGFGGDNDITKTGGGYVRCVRGGQEPSQSLTDNGNGTVTDSSTGLMWQQAEPGGMTLTNALSYCNGLNLGGNADWRLPNINELDSIVDFTRYHPAMNTTFFPNVYASFSGYWSSTTYAGANGTGGEWLVSFDSGGYGDVGKAPGSYYVRCVRGGQSGPLGNFVLSVSNAGTGSGTVTSSPSGISCGATCSASYSSGTSVTLTATASSGSTFTGWSGACSSQSASATCVVTMNAAESVTANYVASGTTPFSDVPTTESFVSYIEAIYNNGITTGCGSGDYCPSEYVTRDQMAAFLVRATQVEAGQSTVNFTCNGGANCATETPYFSDVPTTDSFFPYVQKLKEIGITTGCGNNDYCPSEYVTRDQMAAFIIRALYGGSSYTPICNGGVTGASLACASTTPYFSDVPATDQFFPYVQKMKELGITTGCANGNYCPSENVTRDQMAAFLSRAFLGMK